MADLSIEQKVVTYDCEILYMQFYGANCTKLGLQVTSLGLDSSRRENVFIQITNVLSKHDFDLSTTCNRMINIAYQLT